MLVVGTLGSIVASLQPRPEIFQTGDPGEMEAHVGGQHRRVEYFSETIRVEPDSQSVWTGLSRRGDEELEAVFAQEADDEHAVHVFQDRLVVVHFG